MNLLPLSLYIEMHDLLYLIAFKQGKYDVELSKLDSIQESTTCQHSRGELQINKNRLVRSDKIFFHRTKVLYNSVLKVYSNYVRSLKKLQCQNNFGIISAISTQRNPNAFGALYASVETATLIGNL